MSAPATLPVPAGVDGIAPDEFVRRIAKMGESALVAYMIERRITGMRGHCALCPIAKLFLYEYPGTYAFTGLYTMGLYAPAEAIEDEDQRRFMWFKTPYVVKAFMSNFDADPVYNEPSAYTALCARPSL